MPDHTTTSAARYLAERGYMVSRRRVGGVGPPAADTIKRWCETGKIKGRKVSSRLWLIAQEELDHLLSDTFRNSGFERGKENEKRH